MDELERDREHAELKDLGEALFDRKYINDIPEAYLRELKRYLDTVTARVGIVKSHKERAAYWLNGNSLGILGCTGTSDNDIESIGGGIRQLEHIIAVNLTVNTHYNGGNQPASTGRRLTIGDPDSPDIVLDASPGLFLPEKRAQIEQFIDQLLAALAGR
jgi:hypothetical protein